MIEVNLLPDVKQEFIRAKRVRASVVSIAILISMAAVGIVVLLSLYVFGVQNFRNQQADTSITEQSKKLAAVEDINNTLTIQNQLSVVSKLHDEKYISSRFFSVLAAINPPAPNNVVVSKVVVDTENKTISIEGQAANGYPAFETFRKTIEATKLTYQNDENVSSAALASNIVEGERSYGNDENGQKVLRFSLTFNYTEELFNRSLQQAAVNGPSRSNATDSYEGVPKSLFGARARDNEGEN
jgi:hypothetical protein